jgi:hypothetical protein
VFGSIYISKELVRSSTYIATPLKSDFCNMKLISHQPTGIAHVHQKGDGKGTAEILNRRKSLCLDDHWKLCRDISGPILAIVRGHANDKAWHLPDGVILRSAKKPTQTVHQ